MADRPCSLFRCACDREPKGVLKEDVFILITGATGHVGRGVANILSERNVRLRLWDEICLVFPRSEPNASPRIMTTHNRLSMPLRESKGLLSYLATPNLASAVPCIKTLLMQRLKQEFATLFISHS